MGKIEEPEARFQEYKEYKEFKEFKKRSQESESRSQEVMVRRHDESRNGSLYSFSAPWILAPDSCILVRCFPSQTSKRPDGVSRVGSITHRVLVRSRCLRWSAPRFFASSI